MRTYCVCFILILTFCVSAGCRRYVDVLVRVEDAETQAPIGGAVVRAEYIRAGLTLADFLPFGTRLRELRRSTSLSDASGLATVELTPDSDTMFQGASAKAHGYLEGVGAPVSKDVLRQLRASKRKTGTDDAEPIATVQLLAEPAPQVLLVIPDGYRGVVRLVSRFSAKPAVPGQRLFTCAVSPDEMASVELPLLPIRYDYRSPWSFGAKYATGGELPSRGRALATDVALRVTDSRGDQHLLVIGTEAEREAVYDYCNPGGLPNETHWRTIWDKGTMPVAGVP